MAEFRPAEVSASYWEGIASSDVSILGTFPIPAGRSLERIDRVRFDRQHVSFPRAGAYYFYSSIGAYKVLILDGNSSPLERALSICSFAAQNIVHSRADERLSFVDGPRGDFRWDLLAQKLFYSDQPLFLHCGDAALFVIALLRLHGFEARYTGFSDGINGHVVLEVFDPDERRWVMVDPDFGVQIADATGRLLSTEEIEEEIQIAVNSAQPYPADGPWRPALQVVNISGKAWLKPEFNVDNRYSTPITWIPAHASEKHPSSGYMDMLKAKLRTIYYRPLTLDPAKSIVSTEEAELPPEIEGIDAHLLGAHEAAGKPGDSLRIALAADRFSRLGGFCWIYNLADSAHAEILEKIGDSNAAPRLSPAQLYEDGKLLGPKHSVHRHISSHGKGAYSHWASTLYFSASDNSDPTTNGRSYELVFPLRHRP